MNCLEFRRAIAADPRQATAELHEHRTQCPACEQYAQEMLRMDGLIKRALEIPVPVTGAVMKAPQRGRWYAMAASILLAVGIGAVWFLGSSRDSLAGDVVKHVEEERESMQRSDVRIAAELLDGVLRAKDLHLAASFGDISYLQSCELRGRIVPHIVVQTDRGPVTVLLLAEEKIEKLRRFEEHGYRGVLIPMQKGSAAVLATDASLAEFVAEKVKSAITWD